MSLRNLNFTQSTNAMKTNTPILVSLLVVSHLWAQEAQVEINLDDIVVIEDVTVDGAAPSVEIQDVDSDIEVLTVDQADDALEFETPDIPIITESLPDETEVVLELPGQASEQTGTVSLSAEETISVDFPDEDVRTILRNVADLFDLNLVIPESLQGRTSIKLSNITWEQVFEVVLDPFGYTFVEDRNIIRIKSVEELSLEPVDTRVFIVNYAPAKEILGSIQSLIDTAAGGQVKVDARSNALVVTERPSQMNKVQEIIDTLDKPTSQVMIESKFIEVTNTESENIGVNWAMLDSYTLRAGGENAGDPFTREFTRERSKTLEDTLTTTDGTTNTSGFGLDAGLTNDTLNTTGETVGQTLTNLAGTSRLDTAVFSVDQFEVILSALKANNDIKLVSNPTVVTLDNKEAKIAIGERFPIPQYSFNGENATRQLDGVEYEDIGIKLDVTPQVNSAGFINLSIVPEVSSRLGVAIVEGTEIPIIASRRTETNIMIKDGFTLAIGGLTENETSQEASKVPVLGDLPGLGRVFRSKSDRVEQRNLIIFITAKTLNPDGSTYRDIIDPRVLNTMGIIPSDVPGYELPAEELDLLRKIENFRNELEESEKLESTREILEQLEKLKMEAEAAELTE